MDHLGLVLAMLAAASGLLAAFYWLRASKVQIIPMWEVNGRIEPVTLGSANTEWIVGLLETSAKSNGLNAIAARWTAVSVVLGGASSLASALWSFSPT